MVVLLPLVIPILAMLLSIPTALELFTKKYRIDGLLRKYLLCATITAAVFSSILPNTGQSLFDLRLPIPVIIIITNASFFLFFFALTGAWVLIGRDWKRWLLLGLVPVAIFDHLRWALAFIYWYIYGFV